MLRSQKYGKIKKRDADLFNGAASGSTPNKAKGAATLSSAKRGRGKNVAADVEDDEEEDEENPVKKVKKTPKKERKSSHDDM